MKSENLLKEARENVGATAGWHIRMIGDAKSIVLCLNKRTAPETKWEGIILCLFIS